MRAQTAVTGFAGFVGREKCDFDLVALQHLRDQRRHLHVAGIQRQVHRLLAFGRRVGQSYATAKKPYRPQHALHQRQRGLWSRVQTPCGDLPTLTLRTTLRVLRSITVSLLAQREPTYK